MHTYRKNSKTLLPSVLPDSFTLCYYLKNDLDLIALTVTLHREAGGEVRQRPAPLGIREQRTAPIQISTPRIPKPTKRLGVYS